MLQIEKVRFAGTKRLGYKSDISPVVKLFNGSKTAIMFMIIVSTTPKMFPNCKINFTFSFMLNHQKRRRTAFLELISMNLKINLTLII